MSGSSRNVHANATIARLITTGMKMTVRVVVRSGKRRFSSTAKARARPTESGVARAA